MVIKQVVVSGEFKQQLKKLKDRKSREILKKHIKKLCENPDTGKPLEGAYKLLYSIKGETLHLVRFRHRKKAY